MKKIFNIFLIYLLIFGNHLLSANDKTWKNIIFARDLNINVLDYESNKTVQHFLSSML